MPTRRVSVRKFEYFRTIRRIDCDPTLPIQYNPKTIFQNRKKNKKN